VASTLRSSETNTFLRVMLPLAAPSIAAGATMAFARALGEFGATITFAGNLPGATQTLPLAVYVAMQSDLEAAIVMAVLLMAMAFVLLLALRSATPESSWNRDHARDTGSAPAR
jgi:molybdate transport system permease protein